MSDRSSDAPDGPGVGDAAGAPGDGPSPERSGHGRRRAIGATPSRSKPRADAPRHRAPDPADDWTADPADDWRTDPEDGRPTDSDEHATVSADDRATVVEDGRPSSPDDESVAETDADPTTEDEESVAEADVAPAGEAGPAPAVGPYRPELQGLRAVAILMVVCYHIWFGRVSGGVDIFLLISAFLLTGSFTRKLEDGRLLRVPTYWLHTFKRLVPPGALIILLTLGAGLLILPATRWLDLLQDCIASLAYGENWLLASRAVDYYAADHSTASPLQHYWSLSMQGQVFLLWPALFALAALIVRRTRLRPRPVLLVIFGVITISSFWWSVQETSANQAFAYFDTRTRLWEFSLGSVLALTLPWIERRIGYRSAADPTQGHAHRIRAALGWLGLALVLACGWVVDVQGAFPGWIALWPLLAASLVIAAGPTGTRWGADRFLSGRPLRWLGDISYALYLVHWPLLILLLVAWDTSHLDAVQGVLAVLASVLLAWLVTRLVDAPVRRSAWLEARWWRSGLAILLACALVIGPVWGVKATLDSRARAVEVEAARNNPGARSLRPGFTDEADPDAQTLPDLAQLPHDWFTLPDSCTGRFTPHGDHADLSHYCSQEGDGRGRTIVVVGSSRDQQMAPAFASLAEAHGWTIVLIWVGGCPFSQGPQFDGWCNAHNQQIEKYLLDTKPDVVASASTFIGGDLRESSMPGYKALAEKLLDQGITVVGYRDAPRTYGSLAECVKAGSSDEDACTFDVTAEYQEQSPAPWASRGASPPAGFHAVDVTESICPERTCVPRIGNVYVWMDAAHISTAYSRTLGPAVEDQLTAQGFTWG